MTDSPASAPAEVAADAHPALPSPTPRTAGRAVLVVVLTLLGAALVGAVILLFASWLGAGAVTVGAVLALVPLAIVLLGVRWVDQWEPEPRWLALIAFLWGAGVSTIAALAVGAEVDAFVASVGGGGELYDAAAAVVQAPIVEELGKGLGLLAILWFARRHVDGPVDGLVYAAWVASGFAFTENILYFATEFANTGSFDDAVGQLFLIRGLLSPFAHVMFTACIGVALGLAARRVGRLGSLGYFAAGLAGAIALHAFWNGALLVVSDFIGYYLIVQVPLFLAAIAIVRGLRRRESAVTRERLAEYAAAGWVSADEVDALATPQGRRAARVWARSHGCAAELRDYVRVATRLAFARQRIIAGPGRAAAQADEAALLGALVSARRALVAAAPEAAPPSAV